MKILSTKGSTLLETMVSLLLLGIVLVLLFVLMGSLFPLNKVSKDLYEEGDQLNTIQNDIEFRLKSETDKTYPSISTNLSSIFVAYPEWDYENLVVLGNHCQFDLVHLIGKGEHRFETQIYLQFP